jgi:hypothetical protein
MNLEIDMQQVNKDEVSEDANPFSLKESLTNIGVAVLMLVLAFGFVNLLLTPVTFP